MFTSTARFGAAPSALLLSLLAALSIPGALFAQRTETVFSGALPEGGALRLATATGEVDVRPASGATLEVTGVAHGQEGDITFEVVRNGDEMIVCALRAGIDRCTDQGVESRNGRWSDDDSRGDLRVLLPAGIDLTAGSGNGAVRVEGAGGDVAAASGNGSVDVDGAAGRVHAASGNGAVTVARAGGPVEASSGNGRVEVSTARGPVTASSGNGDLQIDIASLPGDGPMRFSSGNGRIELTLPADFNADLEARLGNGKVESDFPMTIEGRLDPHRVEARIGRGGRRLIVSSGNGDLVLRRR
jgi:hypothetical protein